jgi:Holliday junction resolvase RusA-like endonuclease
VPELRFFVPGVPAPQGSKIYGVTKAGRPYGYEQSKGLPVWRDTVTAAARAMMRETPEWPAKFDGPVGLEIVFYFPELKTSRYWKTTAPDLDKLVRAIGDALTKAGVFKDDARIVRLETDKVHGPVTGATIRVRTIQPSEKERNA